MKIVILGIQGSGKSTQAEALSERLNIPMISLGGLLREAIANEDTFVTQWYTQEDIDAGHLAPDHLVKAVLKRELNSRDSFIIEGFPRTLDQAEFMIDTLPIDRVVEVVISEECAVERLTSRGRSDDTVEGIKNRLHAYYESIFPIREAFQVAGLYEVVDGENPINTITESIESIVLQDSVTA